jgi:hypothetical protein
MEVVTYGCVTSVEAGGEVAGVNVGCPGFLGRCLLYTFGCETSMESVVEAKVVQRSSAYTEP